MCELTAVTLLVRDYDEAIAYFTASLGFVVREDTRISEDKRWVVVAPSYGSASLVLARAVGAAQEAAVGRQAGGRVWLFLRTSDFDRDHRRMRERGVAFAEQPRDETYGKVAVFEDLYGNRWDLVESRRSMDSGRLATLVQSSYDRLARRYAEVFWSELDDKPFDREWLATFSSGLEGGGPVLDVGCGPAQIGRYLADRGQTVIGLDLSHAMLREARERNPALPAVCMDMRQLGLAAERFSGAAAFYSLIHLFEEGIEKALAELYRVLMPGGSLLVSMHGGSGCIEVEEMLGERVPMYATLLSLEKLRTLVERAGFAVQQAESRSPYAFEYPTTRHYVLARRRNRMTS